MRSKNVVALEIEFKSTYKLNSTKKSCQPNWEYEEVMALIQAKQNEYLIGLDMVDSRDQFESASCRWQKIANAMNANGHLSMLRNNATCKNKWGTIYEEPNCTLITWLQQEKHKVLRFDPTKEDEPECVSPIQ